MMVVRRIRGGAGSMRVHVIAVSCVCASMTVLAASGLTFQAPDGWKALPPSSSMRVADFSLPRAAGDAEDAELVVYYFGGEGGGVDANIARWESQMVPPPGKTPVPTVRETRTVNGLQGDARGRARHLRRRDDARRRPPTTTSRASAFAAASSRRRRGPISSS